MEINDQSLAVLRDLLEKTLSRDNAIRKNAESVIQSTKTQAGFPLLILSLITKLNVAATAPLDAAIRQSASIFFKNIVKEHWNPEEGYVIPVQEKETIKTHLVELMTNAAPDVQRQLGEAVSIVAKHDFPEHWSSLLSQLVAKLATNDLTIIKGVMLTANSIFKRYRYVAETESLLIEIKYCLDQFAMPLLQQFQQLSQRVLHSEQNNPELPLLFESLRLMSRIFYSLNWQDIPEVFEDNGSAWMTAFATYLTYKNPLLTATSNNKDEPGPIENLQTAILENINLYANKYEDVFEPYLPQFTQVVWKLLLEVDTNVKYDQLATNGIKFLTTVASKQMNVALFNDQVLQDIIQQIVVKNITATENDEELFDMNPSDYIRKDMEGSDQDTRRRAAVDLIRTLMKFFANKVSELCLNYINVLLQQYHTTKNWKAKDAALHIVLAVSVQSTNPMTGLSELNSSINIVGIFEQHVLPEIHDNNINNSTTSNAIVKADAIKLICILRNHFPKPFLVNILPHIIRYLQAESVVVQTYAAMCIEKFLTIKDKDPKTNQSTVRLDQSDLLQHFQPLFGGLFNVLENPELSENEYVMKCIMRSLVVAGKEVTPVTDLIVSHLLKALEKVYKNPINPYFNHYLFESLALIIKLSCGNEGNATLTEAQANACNKFETILFPIFQVILTQDIAEFIPYVFQIFAQLLAARPKRSGLSDAYRALFPPLLAPVLWERKGNVPALVDLFKAFISRGMNEIIAGNYLTGVLGVFQKLLSAKSTENSAFQLLNTIYAFCPLATITPFIPTIFNLLLLRMQESVKVQKVQPFVRSFVHSISVFSTVYGPNVLYDALESQTPGLVAMIILNVWSHNIQNCAAATKSEKKDILVGGTKLLLESKLVANVDAWKGLLIALLPLTEDAVEHDFLFDALEQEEIKAFDSTYSKLAHSSIYSLDVTADVPSGITYFSNALNQFSQVSSNEFIGRVQQLNPEQQRAVQVVLQKR